MNNLKFSDLPQYQKDLKYFTAKLSTITNPSLKTVCNNLLKQMSEHALLIDASHDFDPRLIEENRIKIIEIRKQLTSVVNDLQRT